MKTLKEKLKRTELRFRMSHSPFFDKEWYTQQNHLPKGTNPCRHYLEGGWQTSDPSPRFSNERYLEANLDVRIQKVCPLEHYLLYGKKEKRKLFIGQIPGKKWMFAAEDREKEKPKQTGGAEPYAECPLVSVIIPTYNRAQTIVESCQSVLNQTYRNLELIVVDDCSDDETGRKVHEIKDPRVRYIRHSFNQGACAARNTGIENATGEYIAFQDSDDLWEPEKLALQMEMIYDTGGDICFCRYQHLEADGTESKGPSYYFCEGIQQHIYTVFGIGTQTLLIRREILRENLFDPEMPRFQDLELLVRLAKKYRFCMCGQPLVTYRTGEDSISKSSERLLRACELLLKKHGDLKDQLPLMCRELAYFLLYTAENEIEDERRRDLARLAIQFDFSRDVRRESRKYL